MSAGQGGAFSRWLGRTVLRLSGWKILGEIPAIPEMVIIVAPHTSNWDFIIGIAAKLALNLKASWLGKHSIFFWPLTPLLRHLGGIPVDRNSAQGVVEDVAHLFKTRDHLVLALSPEGTRKRVEKWKTGFYRIAVLAAVPILMIRLDYATKAITIGPLLHPTGDLEQDLTHISEFFAGATGKHPDQFSLPKANHRDTER